MNERLIDKPENGRRERPWRAQKRKSLALGASYIRIGKKTGRKEIEKKGARVTVCADDVEFSTVRNNATGAVSRKLTAANFCRDRLCPMCQWRKSLVMFGQLSRVMDYVESENPNAIPIFVTLTVRNCNEDDAQETIDALLNGWTRLRKSLEKRGVCLGSFRALEIAPHADKKELHPHLHAVVMVPREYFSKACDMYMTTVEWSQAWRKAAGLDYDPVCDVRRIKGGEKISKAVAEVAKYAVKPGDWLSDDRDTTDFMVDLLSRVLRGRRLVSFSGILSQARKALKMADVESADLVATGDDVMLRNDVVMLIEHYRWSVGVTDYVKSSERVPDSELLEP